MKPQRSDPASCFNDLPRVAQSGFVRLGRVLALAALVIAVGAGCGKSDSDSATKGKGPATEGPREVDFGFVELIQGQPTPVVSFKNGGDMMVYPGEEFRYQSLSDSPLGDAPIPPIELRVGDTMQVLPGTEGKVQITGPAGKPLQAILMAEGSRHSLPGGAPPKFSVKVQIYGSPRPK